MEKISHIWSVICSQSIVDEETKNISLRNLLEKITISIPKEEVKKIKDRKKIMIPFNQELVSRFYKNIKNKSVIFEIRIDVLNPDMKIKKGKDSIKINFDKKFENIRVRNKITSIPVEGSGIYKFILKAREFGEIKFNEVASIPIEIEINFEK